jgi:hypothetical protein
MICLERMWLKADNNDGQRPTRVSAHISSLKLGKY